MKDAYVAALVEDMNGKFDLIMEFLSPLQQDVRELKHGMSEVKYELKLIGSLCRDREVRIRAVEVET